MMWSFSTRTLVLIFALAVAMGRAELASAQTSYATVSVSESGPGCMYPNDPWSQYYTGVTVTARHKISCSTGELILETQTISGQYTSTCGGNEAQLCLGRVEAGIDDQGSTLFVSAFTVNGYRMYVASEYWCGFYPMGLGGVTFTKVSAEEVCPQ